MSESRDPDASSVVVFIPHAGGNGEAFLPWFRSFPAGVDCRYLQLPGRGKRMGENMPDSLGDLAEEVLDELSGLHDKRISIFGHSMGALIAFELGQKMETAWDTPAERLFFSGCRAPSRPAMYQLSGLDDEALIEKLAGLGGASPSVLERAEVRELFLPTLRQDIVLAEHYVARDLRPLRAPLHILWGTEDRSLTDEMIMAWRELSRDGRVWFHPHPGDHFYHQAQPGSVRAVMQHALGLDPAIQARG
ncbi:thioesterase II family protein [Streptomyces huasconensis]|uniref:thioesterase II family protein n=1 Tax=Streptomyces huasconensis TaxID=1854574 RepID=UPI0033DA6CD9